MFYHTTSVKDLIERYSANPESFWMRDTDEIIELGVQQQATDEGFLFDLMGLIVNDLKSLDWAHFLGMVLCHYENTEELPDNVYDSLYEAFIKLLDYYGYPH